MTRRGAPPIQWLVVFDSVAATLSFKEAARQLNVSPSAVSQQVKTLEDWLEMPLFERHTRRISLTEAGRYYQGVASDLVQTHKRGHAEFLRRFHNHSLHVSAPLFVAQELMIPGYLSFSDYMPATELRIEARSSYVDFDSEPMDVAIRFGDGQWPQLQSRLLCGVSLAPVCSREYLQANPMEQWSDLSHQKLIVPMADAPLWQTVLGEESIDKQNLMICDSYLAAITSASKGLGVALALLPSSNNWINDGRLVMPFNIEIKTHFAYWMVAPATRSDSGELDAFYQWAKGLFDTVANLQQTLQKVELPLQGRSI